MPIRLNIGDDNGQSLHLWLSKNDPSLNILGVENAFVTHMLKQKDLDTSAMNIAGKTNYNDLNIRNTLHILNNEPELGERFCLINDFQNDTSVNQLYDEQVTFTYTVNSKNNLLTRDVKVDDNTAPFVNSNIKFTTYDGLDGSGSIVDSSNNLKVKFDLQDSNYNGFKAANYDKYVGEHGINSTTKLDFNNTYSLLSFNEVARDTSSNELTASDNLLSDLSNNGINVTLTNRLDATPLFGTYKFIQTGKQIDVIQENLDTLVDDQQNNLPSQFTEASWNNLWTQDVLNVIGQSTVFEINTTSNLGGYSSSNVGFSLDDSNLTNNIPYMEKAKGNHSILINNGSLSKTTNASMTDNTTMYNIIDSSEALNSLQYNNDLNVKLWFTNQTNTFDSPTGTASNFTDGLQRTKNIDNSGNTFTSTSVYYPGEESLSNDVGVLSNSDLTTYDISYNVRVVNLSTSAQVSSYNNDNVISKSNEDWVAVIPNTTLNMNKSHFQNFITDPTINSSIDLSNNEISVFNVKSNLIWTEQIYHTQLNDPTVNALTTDNVPVSGTNMFVKGTNINLNNIATDLRLIMEPKTINDLPSFNNSNFTREFIGDYTNIASNKSVVNIMGTDTYDIINTDVSNDILTFTYKFGSNEVAQNIDMLSNMIIINYSNINNSITGSTIIPETSITNLSNNNVNVETNLLPSNLFTGLPVGYSVFRKTNSSDLQCQIPFTISSIYNMTTTTNIFKQLDTSYYVTDNKGRILPDSYLKQITFNSDGSQLTASRMFSLKLQNNTYSTPAKSFSSSIMFKISDLLLYKIKIQKFVNSEWVDMTDYYPFDIAYDSICNITLDISQNSLVEIAIDTDKNTTYSDIYVCNMALENSSLSFDAEGRIYNITDSSVNNYLKNNNWDITKGFMPNNIPYRTVNGLNTDMSYIGQNLTNQGILHLDVNRFSENLFSIESVTNIVTNLLFGIVPSNILHVKSYKNNTLFLDKLGFAKYYNKHILDSGVAVGIDSSNILVGDKISFKLSSDPVSVSLYNNYNGRLSSDSELIPATGLSTDSSISVNVKFNKWRGIVKPLNIQDLYQEDIHTRTPTTITFRLEYNGSVWTQNLGDLYAGSYHVINDISGNSNLGSLGLIINGLYSKYSTSNFTNTSSITVTFDKAYVKLTNGNVDASYINFSKEVSFSEVLLHQFESLSIKAAKVKAYNNEKYNFINSFGKLDVYHSPEYVVSNTTKDTLTYTKLFTLMFNNLINGVYINNSLNNNYSLDNSLNYTWYIKYNTLNINEFVDYCVCPKPQIKFSAFRTNEFNTFPYIGTRITKFVDLYSDINQMYPFENIDGVNNLCFSYINSSSEKYMKFRTSQFNELSELVSYPIVSNKLQLDLYYGLSNEGDIFIKNIFNDYISNLVNNEKQTDIFNATLDEETLLYSVKAFHDLGLEESAYSNLFFGEKPLNLQFSGISDFQIGNNFIDFISGKTHNLSLLSCIQDFDSSSNEMFFTIVKYLDNNRSSVESTDFSEVNFITANRSLKLNAMKRYTSKVSVTDISWSDTTPINYIDFLNRLSNVNLNWELDTNFVPRVLLLSVNALCGSGLNILTDFISVTDSYPLKVAYFNTPDFIRCENSLGNAVVRITAMGDIIMDQAILRNIIGYNSYTGVTTQNSSTVFVKYGNEHAPNS